MRTIILSFVVLFPSLVFSQTAAPSAETRFKALEERLNKLEGSASQASPLSAFNPAIGVAVDMVTRHDDDKGRFDFRGAELNLSAPIDPFLKGWTIINGNATKVEVEEAALQTTALPLNTTVRAGRLFADFGRLGRFHDHELPAIDRPRSLDTFIGGETQADGVEAAVLVPFPGYLSATIGAYNKLGGENARQANDTPRSWSEMTYLGRLATAAEAGSDHTFDLGVSAAWTPKRVLSPDPALTAVTSVEVRNTWRVLGGADFAYRWHPAGAGVLRGALWGTEVLMNDERRVDTATSLPGRRVKAWAGYSFVQLIVGRRWRPGFMADVTSDLDERKRTTRTYTAFLTFDVSEFQKLRAAYARTASRVDGVLNNDTVGLQWSAVLGRHVHGFRDR